MIGFVRPMYFPVECNEIVIECNGSNLLNSGVGKGGPIAWNYNGNQI